MKIKPESEYLIILSMVYSKLGIFMAIKGLPIPPADILEAALVWLGRLHRRNLAVISRKIGELSGCNNY